MSFVNRVSSRSSSFSVHSSTEPIGISSASSAGRSSRFHSLDWRLPSSVTRARIPASAWPGSMPSAESTPSPAASWSSRPATLTMKNSSRFDEWMATNLTRSSSGCEASSASSSTRALNSSHESSRFSSLDGALSRRSGMGASCQTTASGMPPAASGGSRAVRR